MEASLGEEFRSELVSLNSDKYALSPAKNTAEAEQCLNTSAIQESINTISSNNKIDVQKKEELKLP